MIDGYVFVAILNLVFKLILCFCFVPFFFSLFFLLWLDFLLYYVCVLFFLVFMASLVCFWFVIILFFKYVNPLLYLLALDCYPYRLKHILKKKSTFSYSPPLYFMILMSPFTYSYLSFLLFIVVIIAFTKFYFLLFLNLYTGLFKWFTFQLWFFSFV